MTLKIAIQMDALTAINPAGDSTLLIGLEAQRRGYALWHYTPDKLKLENGEVIASAGRVTLSKNIKNHFMLGRESQLKLKDMDVVLLRQDPPFDIAYITTTYLLERLHPETLVVNDPTSVRDHPEKLIATLFPEFMPPTLVTANAGDIRAFRKTHKDIVVKPLYGHGGHGVLRFKPDDTNFEAVMESGSGIWMAQPFLPEVKNKECRVILIDGKIEGAMRRIPAKGEIRSNLRVGGTAAKVTLSRRQREICEAVGPLLRQEGLVFAGLDLIGDRLTEINITSPTGMVSINKLHGTKLESKFWDAVEERL